MFEDGRGTGHEAGWQMLTGLFFVYSEKKSPQNNRIQLRNIKKYRYKENFSRKICLS